MSYTFSTSREIAASASEVFAAISNPERFARWWGPAGFTNTFHVCEFKPGGRWSFVMHGPDGANYDNENVFEQIEAPYRVVIRHVNEPLFTLRIELKATASGTLVAWEQVLDNAELAAQIAHIIEPANEQNLDRLTIEVLSQQRATKASASDVPKV